MAKLHQPSYDKLSKTQKRLVDKAVWRGVPKYKAVCIMVSTSRYRHISFAVGLALFSKESNYSNVFGHDPVRSVPKSWMGHVVTKPRYLVYKLNRKRGLGMQGVGDGQLTWFETQDYADKQGGCHKSYVNIDVACQTLAARIRDFGYVRGIERYNGSGAAAVAYSRDVRKRAASWRRRLK